MASFVWKPWKPVNSTHNAAFACFLLLIPQYFTLCYSILSLVWCSHSSPFEYTWPNSKIIPITPNSRTIWESDRSSQPRLIRFSWLYANAAMWEESVLPEEVMIKFEVWGGNGLARQSVFACVCHGGGKCAIVYTTGESPENHFLFQLDLKGAATHTHTCTVCIHTPSADEMVFLKGSSSSRGGASLLAATYDPPFPLIRTHTQAPGNRPSPSLFIQSLISFHQVCLFSFSSPPSPSWRLFCVKSLLSCLPLPLPFPHIFVLFPLFSLLPFFSHPPAQPLTVFLSPSTCLLFSMSSLSLSPSLCSFNRAPLCLHSSSPLLSDLSPSICSSSSSPFFIFHSMGVRYMWRFSTQWEKHWERTTEIRLWGRVLKKQKESFKESFRAVVSNLFQNRYQPVRSWSRHHIIIIICLW